MYYHIVITARNDRDESCLLYKLSWHSDLPREDFTAGGLSELINEVKDIYLNSWPIHNVKAPSKAFIPVDVEVSILPDTYEDDPEEDRIIQEVAPAA